MWKQFRHRLGRIKRLRRFYYKYHPVLFYKRLVRNRPSWQRKHWAHELAQQDPMKAGKLGYRWGNPTDSGDRLGNYASILAELRYFFMKHPQSVVLDLGSYGGKWTKHMLGAKRIICVDLFDESFEFVKKRLPTYPLEFYKTRGDELQGIPDCSVNLVFSIDTLTRASQHVIKSYLREIHRVLAPGGQAILHLPCDDSPMSLGMYFTAVSEKQIVKMIETAGFGFYRLDSSTLNHGMLVTIIKDPDAIVQAG